MQSLKAIDIYLSEIYNEAKRRGYNYDKSKIDFYCKEPHGLINLTEDQLKYEFEHLKKKLKERSPVSFQNIKDVDLIKHHPIFILVKGPIENWEIIK